MNVPERGHSPDPQGRQAREGTVAAPGCDPPQRPRLVRSDYLPGRMSGRKPRNGHLPLSKTRFLGSPAAALSYLFGVAWIVEQNSQFDAAMSHLREVRGTGVPRVQIRRGVVWREQHQRIEEVQ